MGLQAVGSHVSPPPLSDTHGLPRASNGSVLFLASKMDIANTKNVWQQELQDGFVAMDLPPQCGKRHWIRWFKIKYCVDNMNSYRASRIFNLTDFEVLSIEGPQPADDPTVKGRIRFSARIRLFMRADISIKGVGLHCSDHNANVDGELYPSGELLFTRGANGSGIIIQNQISLGADSLKLHGCDHKNWVWDAIRSLIIPAAKRLLIYSIEQSIGAFDTPLDRIVLNETIADTGNGNKTVMLYRVQDIDVVPHIGLALKVQVCFNATRTVVLDPLLPPTITAQLFCEPVQSPGIPHNWTLFDHDLYNVGVLKIKPCTITAMFQATDYAGFFDQVEETTDLDASLLTRFRMEGVSIGVDATTSRLTAVQEAVFLDVHCITKQIKSKLMIAGEFNGVREDIRLAYIYDNVMPGISLHMDTMVVASANISGPFGRLLRLSGESTNDLIQEYETELRSSINQAIPPIPFQSVLAPTIKTLTTNVIDVHGTPYLQASWQCSCVPSHPNACALPCTNDGLNTPASRASSLPKASSLYSKDTIFQVTVFSSPNKCDPASSTTLTSFTLPASKCMPVSAILPGLSVQYSRIDIAPSSATSNTSITTTLSVSLFCTTSSCNDCRYKDVPVNVGNCSDMNSDELAVAVTNLTYCMSSALPQREGSLPVLKLVQNVTEQGAVSVDTVINLPEVLIRPNGDFVAQSNKQLYLFTPSMVFWNLTGKGLLSVAIGSCIRPSECANHVTYNLINDSYVDLPSSQFVLQVLTSAQTNNTLPRNCYARGSHPSRKLLLQIVPLALVFTLGLACFVLSVIQKCHRKEPFGSAFRAALRMKLATTDDQTWAFVLASGLSFVLGGLLMLKSGPNLATYTQSFLSDYVSPAIDDSEEQETLADIDQRLQSVFILSGTALIFFYIVSRSVLQAVGWLQCVLQYFNRMTIVLVMLLSGSILLVVDVACLWDLRLLSGFHQRYASNSFLYWRPKQLNAALPASLVKDQLPRVGVLLCLLPDIALSVATAVKQRLPGESFVLPYALWLLCSIGGPLLSVFGASADFSALFVCLSVALLTFLHHVMICDAPLDSPRRTWSVAFGFGNLILLLIYIYGLDGGKDKILATFQFSGVAFLHAGAWRMYFAWVAESRQEEPNQVQLGFDNGWSSVLSCFKPLVGCCRCSCCSGSDSLWARCRNWLLETEEQKTAHRTGCLQRVTFRRLSVLIAIVASFFSLYKTLWDYIRLTPAVALAQRLHIKPKIMNLNSDETKELVASFATLRTYSVAFAVLAVASLLLGGVADAVGTLSYSRKAFYFGALFSCLSFGVYLTWSPGEHINVDAFQDCGSQFCNKLSTVMSQGVELAAVWYSLPQLLPLLMDLPWAVSRMALFLEHRRAQRSVSIAVAVSIIPFTILIPTICYYYSQESLVIVWYFAAFLPVIGLLFVLDQIVATAVFVRYLLWGWLLYVPALSAVIYPAWKAYEQGSDDAKCTVSFLGMIWCALQTIFQDYNLAFIIAEFCVLDVVVSDLIYELCLDKRADKQKEFGGMINDSEGDLLLGSHSDLDPI
eukprot:m.76732 g.76732  ORF g.76732 m.76732 type:complete len:1541 (+) comp12495_c1_seq6:259-4881(+)